MEVFELPRGGARTRSGPPPDPHALHRDKDAKEWKVLPEEGRQGEVPDWPLTRGKAAEKEMWAELWTMSQAVEWERQRQHLEVALYVRKFLEAAQPKSPANLTTAARQMADSLGLTVPGMLRNKWRIGELRAPEVRPKTANAGAARRRFGVVDGGA